MTASATPVYESRMPPRAITSPTMRAPSCLAALTIPLLFWVCWPPPVNGERPPLTKNVPISEFQNKADNQGYDFDAPPKGIFHTIQFSKDFEQEIGFRRTHEIKAVNPTDTFGTDTQAVYVVFKLHQHYEPFQVTGLCYPEEVEGLDPHRLLARDAMEFGLADESGYLQFFAPPDGWKPGRYKVEIHLGWEVSEISLMGTMRFTVIS